MTFDHKKIDKILESIFPLPEEFGLVCYFSDSSEPINKGLLTEALFEVDPDAYIYFGATKLVILSPSIQNVVIKIPFNGSYFEDEDGSINWSPFYWAPGSDKTDYCLAEYEKYNRLKAYRLDCFVAKTFLYKTIDNVRVFIQEKIIPCDDCCSETIPSERSRQIASKWVEEGTIAVDSEWIALCLDKYGKSKVERFLWYCNNIDLDILADAHMSNIGYRFNGTPAILDYANFLD